RIALKTQRTEHTNRIKGLLAGLGLSLVIDAELPPATGGAPPVGRHRRADRHAAAHPSGVRALATRRAADPRPGSPADPSDPRPSDPPGRTNAAVPQAEGDRGEQRVAVGPGILRLARHPQPSRTGEPGRLDADSL